MRILRKYLQKIKENYKYKLEIRRLVEKDQKERHKKEIICAQNKLKKMQNDRYT